MDFNMLYKDAIDKRFDELKVKQVVKTFKGIDIYESKEEHHNRIKSIYWDLLKVNGKDTVFAFFLSTLQNIIDNGSIPSELIFDFALEQFKERQYPRREVWPELNDWFELSKEDIEKLYVEFKACDKALEELYIVNNPDIKTAEEVKESEVGGIPKEKKTSVSRATKIIWTGNEEQIKTLYKCLFLVSNKADKNYYKLNYIDCPDYKVFLNNFKGVRVSKKILWLKSLGELIYLMDNLSEYIDNSIYQKENDKIKPIIGKHFELFKNDKIHTIDNRQILYDARSRFLKGLENDNSTKQKSKKILSIIQSIG